MKEGYKALGEFIRQIDIRNTEGKEDNLLGVSVQKQFIPSIANTVGTDFTKYKVVKKGQFTYIPDTSRRGDKIAIALLQDYEEGLVSNVYTVFEVIDEEKLLPEYLVPFPVSWTVKMKKKQKETQDILSYHSQAAGCSDKARAKASGGRQPIEECGRTGL